MTCDWRDIEGAWDGGQVLVAGNGPSAADPTPIYRFRGATIGCNERWNQVELSYVVCYDQKQAEAVPSRYDGALVVPGSEKWALEDDRWLIADPHDRNRIEPVDQNWGGPSEIAYGNLSGYLAFQLAILLGAREVYFYGMDVGGQRGDDGLVHVRAPGWAEYGAPAIPPSLCEEVEGALVPRGWVPRLRFWRSLTDWAAARGISCWRLRNAGAMTWLPVREPDAQPDQAVRVPT